MNVSDLLIAWSIRIAMLFLFVVLVFRMQNSGVRKSGLQLKILWTISFLFCLLHVLAAFHFVHHWNHNEAYLATANETRNKLGFAYGEGIYFNYLFMIVWAMDVFWTWWSTGNPSLPMRWLVFGGRCFLVFIAFNGVVVFKSGWLRTIGAIATIWLLGLAIRRGKPLFPSIDPREESQA